MSWSEILQVAFAIGIILATLHDVVHTVISHHGAGPITGFWTGHFWRGILWTKYKLKINFFYRSAGPTVLVGIIVVWYLLLNIGWFLLLESGDFSVKGKSDYTLQTTDLIYFLSSTFTTLGMGDYVPNGFPWTLVATSGALVMSVLTTLSISYIIPIISAVVDRRKLISAINIIGRSPRDLLKYAWSGETSGHLDSEVLGVSDSIVRESFRSHAYPILSFFSFNDSHSSLNLPVLNLYDVLSAQKLFPHREGNISSTRRDYLLNAINVYLSNLDFNLNIYKIDCAHQDYILFLQDNFGSLEEIPKEVMENHLKCRTKLLRLAHREGVAPVSPDGKLRHPWNYER